MIATMSVIYVYMLFLYLKIKKGIELTEELSTVEELKELDIGREFIKVSTDRSIRSFKRALVIFVVLFVVNVI